MKMNHNFSRAFTIIELAVVVVVIGILAGLTVLGYGKWQDSTAKKAVQSDLQIAAAAMENAKNFGNGYPASIPSTFTTSPNVVVTYYSGSTSTSYCIDGTYPTRPTVSYFISSIEGPKPLAGTCAGGENIGQDWTARAAAEANSWTAVTYGNGLFVAVSSNGTNRVMTSPDGITWTARTAAQANSWTAVTYGNGLFVAVSSDGTNQVMTSPDGITWTARTPAATPGWSSIMYGNGKFLAASLDSMSGGMYSTDGITWATTNYGVSGNVFRSIAFGRGVFVVAGGQLTSGSFFSTSDAITWTRRTVLGNANYMKAIAYGGGKFVALSLTDAYAKVSPDGLTWSEYSVPSVGWTGLAYGNKTFVAVAQSGTNRVMTSQTSQ